MKNGGWKISFLLGKSLFRGYVKLWEGIFRHTSHTAKFKDLDFFELLFERIQTWQINHFQITIYGCYDAHLAFFQKHPWCLTWQTLETLGSFFWEVLEEKIPIIQLFAKKACDFQKAFFPSRKFRGRFTGYLQGDVERKNGPNTLPASCRDILPSRLLRWIKTRRFSYWLIVNDEHPISIASLCKPFPHANQFSPGANLWNWSTCKKHKKEFILAFQLRQRCFLLLSTSVQCLAIFYEEEIWRSK